MKKDIALREYIAFIAIFVLLEFLTIVVHSLRLSIILWVTAVVVIIGITIKHIVSRRNKS